jgi:hypothetical protein
MAAPMACAAVLLLLLFGAPEPPPATSPAGDAPVILFLIDNSASLPPLDPDAKRVEALERMFTFLQGAPYRLVLFGGRQEIYVDDVSHYRNDGQWTDLYFAFLKARELMATYPQGTRFRIVLLTDGIIDPRPADWEDMRVPSGADLKVFSAKRLIELIGELKVPLYVILVGDLPKQGTVSTGELAPPLVLEMAAAANGAAASPMAQSLAAFFGDDGVLLKKFVFRVAPYEGLKKIEMAVRRIVAPPSGTVEMQFLTFLVLPLTLFLFLLLGILVRSFPGPGDAEILELAQGVPAHIAADRLHKLESGWATTGLGLVPDAKNASASVTYRAAPLDLHGTGLDTTGLDPQSLHLLSLDLPDLKRELSRYAELGSKEEKIYALNLDYMAKSFDPAAAERILSTEPGNRRSLAPLDFLRAKTHLLFDEALQRKLTEPRAQLVSYGPKGTRMDLLPGARPRIGRYGFVVTSLERGGRREVRLTLSYDKVPSLLGLKNWLPGILQRAFRLRRSNRRVVS